MSQPILPPYDGVRGHLIYVGAGDCPELDSLIEAGFARIVLIEPDPDRVARLAMRAREDGRISVLQMAITEEPSLSHLITYDLPDLNALRPPKALGKAYPGLAENGRHMVRSQSLVAFVESLSLNSNAQNVLIFDAPGEAPDSLLALIEADLLGQFDVIRFPSEQAGFYEHPTSADQLDAALAAQGYLIGHDTPFKDPLRPYRCLERIPHADAYRDAQNKVLSLTESNQALRRKLEAATRRADQLQAQLDAAQEDSRAQAQAYLKIEGQVDLLSRFLEQERAL